MWILTGTAAESVKLLRGRVGRVVRELRGDGRGWVLTFVSLGWLLTFGMRFVYPAMLPTVRSVFDVELVTSGFLLSALWLAYAATQLPGGFLADRIGEGITLASGVTGTALGLVAVMSAGSTSVLFGGTLLIGAGAGLFATTRFTVLSDIYTDRDGTAQGITAAMGNVGSSTLPVVATVVTGYLGWQAGFGFAIPLLGVVLLGLLWAVPRRTSQQMQSRGGLSWPLVREIVAGIANRRTLLAASSMFVMAFFFQSFTSFYPTYLVSVKGLTETTAAGIFGLFFAIAIVMQVAAGIVTDWIGPPNTVKVVITTTSIGLVFLPFVSGVGPILVVSAILSASTGFWPTIHTYVIRTLSPEIQGSGLGTIRTIYLLFASSGPALMGIVASRYSFDSALFVLATITVLGIFVALFLPELPDGDDSVPGESTTD